MSFKSLFITAVLLLFLISCKKKDTEPPVVTLIGEASVTIELNGTFSDPGATATDNNDGPLDITISGTVDTDQEGYYIIDYSAIDKAGNAGIASRTVHVRNETASLSGFFKAITMTPADTIDFIAEITSSVSVNKQIWVRGFGTDSTVAVFANIDNNQIDIPKQPGLQTGTTHYFWGTGNVQNVSDTIKLIINYSDSLAGTVNSGLINYSRPFSTY